MNTETTRRIRADIESCCCDYPCSHGPWLNSLRLDEPRPDVAERCAKTGEPIPEYAYSYSEVAEFPPWLATLLLLAPDLVTNLRRCIRLLDEMIQYADNPGIEALGAVCTAKALTTISDVETLLQRLEADPIDIAWSERAPDQASSSSP
jgi:hypothetical protein